MKTKILRTYLVLLTLILSVGSIKTYAAEYYVSNSGSDSNTGTITKPFLTISKGISKLLPGDTLYVRGGTYAGFSVKNSGKENMPITVSGYNNEYPKIKGGNPIKTYQLSYIIIQGFDVSGSNSAAGIRIDKGGNNIVRNNIVHDNLGSGINGIMILNSSNNKVLNNTVYNNRSSGIRNYGSTATNNEIAYNTVYNHTLSTGNSDGINCSDGSNISIHHNIVYGNSDDGIDTWNCHHNTVSFNTVSKNGGTGDGNGIKVGGAVTGGFNTVIGNISFNNKSSGFTSNGSGGNKYYNNTAYGNGKDGFSDSWRNNYPKDKSSFISNIGYNNSRADVSLNSGYTAESHNNIWNKPMWSSVVYSLSKFYTISGLDNPNNGDLSSITGDPKFTNPSSGDFSLKSDSPAINKGDSTNPGNVSANGIPDIGAKEY